MAKYVQKLGSDTSYKKPKQTFQETLTQDEIDEKLQGYEKVEDPAEIPLNVHVRYFTQKDGTQLFRMGGMLIDKQNSDTYVRLSNGKNSWSVQTKDSIFYKKISHKDEIDNLHTVYKKKLEKRDMIIQKLNEYIKVKLGDVDIDLLDDVQIPTSKHKSGRKSSSSTKSSRTTKATEKSSGSKSKSRSKSRSKSKSRSR